jgi:hypothetical protein
MMARQNLLATLAMCAGLLSGCAVALGPGYRVEKQQVEVRWTGAETLEVRGIYQLKNTGTEPMDYIEAVLPEEARRSGLQVWLDQSPVSLEPAAELAPEGTVRIPFRPAWEKKRKASLVIEYALRGAVADAGATPSVYLETRGWYPDLRSKDGLFAFGGEPPKKWDLRITVPREFLVHASGEAKGKKRRDALLEHRFQQRGRDFRPFVVAGRYQEQRISHVILWTLQPRPEMAVRRLGEGVARTTQEYQAAFGKPLEFQSVMVVELPSRATEKAAKSFPGGVFFASDQQDRLLGDPEEVLRALDEHLTYTWFYHTVTATPEAQLLFYEGLPPYGASIAAEARGAAAYRSALASGRLGLYEDAGGEKKEPQFFLNESESSRERIAFARAKAPLFFLALEDRYGKQATRRALARLVESLRGQKFNTNDLRVAIQIETGEDPAEFFRQWLNQPGIPEEFRKKYKTQVTGSR